MRTLLLLGFLSGCGQVDNQILSATFNTGEWWVVCRTETGAPVVGFYFNAQDVKAAKVAYYNLGAPELSCAEESNPLD